MGASQQVVGHVNGVPFVALPPLDPQPDSPVVLAWHLMDPPRSEAAFAAALPMRTLNAWRIYLGLPMNGSRIPEGGQEELLRLSHEDVVTNVFGPVITQALAEFPAAWARLQAAFQLRPSGLGFLGGSLGAAVALEITANQLAAPDSLALVSPLLNLRAAVTAIAQNLGFTYTWSERSGRIADRVDFASRIKELIEAGQPATLIIVGEDDLTEGFRVPARTLRDHMVLAYHEPATVEMHTIAGMGHALADEPGVEPCPQIPAAQAVDSLVSDWFRATLAARPSDH